MIPEHIVELKIGDIVIDTWQSYTITHDFLAPADSFDMTFGVWDPSVDPEPIVYSLRRAAALQYPVELRIDGALQLSGRIDSVEGEEDSTGPTVQIQGRDIGGQVVDCSMPLGFNIVGLPLKEVLERALAPWNIKVVIGNEGNRKVVSTVTTAYTFQDALLPVEGDKFWKGVTKKVKQTISSDLTEEDSFAQPQSINPTLSYYTTVYKTAIANRKIANELKAEPGDTRWDWIAKLLKTQNLLGWFSADGMFIVGTPDYRQEPIFRATRVVERPGSPTVGRWTTADNNVEKGGYTTSPGSRYSKVIVLGRQGKDPIKAVATDPTLTAGGVDRPFYHVDHDIRSIEEAQRVADRLLVDSRIKDSAYTATLTGHGQGDRLFAFDTIWDVWDDSPAVWIHDSLWCSRVIQKYDLATGPTTEVTLQPKEIIEVPT